MWFGVVHCQVVEEDRLGAFDEQADSTPNQARVTLQEHGDAVEVRAGSRPADYNRGPLPLAGTDRHGAGGEDRVVTEAPPHHLQPAVAEVLLPPSEDVVVVQVDEVEDQPPCCWCRRRLSRDPQAVLVPEPVGVLRDSHTAAVRCVATELERALAASGVEAGVDCEPTCKGLPEGGVGLALPGEVVGEGDVPESLYAYPACCLDVVRAREAGRGFAPEVDAPQCGELGAVQAHGKAVGPVFEHDCVCAWSERTGTVPRGARGAVHHGEQPQPVGPDLQSQGLTAVVGGNGEAGRLRCGRLRQHSQAQSYVEARRGVRVHRRPGPGRSQAHGGAVQGAEPRGQGAAPERSPTPVR